MATVMAALYSATKTAVRQYLTAESVIARHEGGIGGDGGNGGDGTTSKPGGNGGNGGNGSGQGYGGSDLRSDEVEA